MKGQALDDIDGTFFPPSEAVEEKWEEEAEDWEDVEEKEKGKGVKVVEVEGKPKREAMLNMNGFAPSYDIPHAKLSPTLAAVTDGPTALEGNTAVGDAEDVVDDVVGGGKEKDDLAEQKEDD